MFAARAIKRVPVQVCARRAMGGGGHSVEQLQAETVTWKKLSYGKFNFVTSEIWNSMLHCHSIEMLVNLLIVVVVD